MSKIKYFKTREQAQTIVDTLPPFKPAIYATQSEIDAGMCIHRINEFDKGLLFN